MKLQGVWNYYCNAFEWLNQVGAHFLYKGPAVLLVSRSHSIIMSQCLHPSHCASYIYNVECCFIKELTPRFHVAITSQSVTIHIPRQGPAPQTTVVGWKHYMIMLPDPLSYDLSSCLQASLTFFNWNVFAWIQHLYINLAQVSNRNITVADLDCSCVKRSPFGDAAGNLHQPSIYCIWIHINMKQLELSILGMREDESHLIHFYSDICCYRISTTPSHWSYHIDVTKNLTWVVSIAVCKVVWKIMGYCMR